MLTRNQEQEKIMFIIYQVLFFNRMKSDFDIVEIIESTMNQSYDEVDTFVKEVPVKCLTHYQEIVDLIVPNCTTWKFERINLIIVAILMMAICEYRYVGEIDKSVVINVAVKLTHKYADEKDYRFVNALLDKVL